MGVLGRSFCSIFDQKPSPLCFPHYRKAITPPTIAVQCYPPFLLTKAIHLGCASCSFFCSRLSSILFPLILGRSYIGSLLLCTSDNRCLVNPIYAHLVRSNTYSHCSPHSWSLRLLQNPRALLVGASRPRQERIHSTFIDKDNLCPNGRRTAP